MDIGVHRLYFKAKVFFYKIAAKYKCLFTPTLTSINLLGLLKIDILGSRSLTIIKKTLEMLKEKNININLDQIPLDDEATFSALQKGKTLGVFQLESSGMSSLLKRLAPSHINDIIAALSLYRPGPLDSGMTEHYLKRKKHKR